MNESLNLANKFFEIAQQFPNKVAMQMKTAQGYVKYTYQDLAQKIEAVARVLQKRHGIKQGDRIVIVLENCPEWGAIYFAILLIGAIAVPIDPQSTSKDLQYFLQHSDSKVVFTSEQFKNLFQGVNIKVELVTVELFARKSGKIQIKENKATAAASILYTSGTTGVPKGVVLTHKNFYANFNSVAKLNIINLHDNVLSLLPLHHSFPFMINLIVPLFSGSKITYVTDLSSEAILKCMRETGITALIGVPQLYYMLHNNILGKLRKIPWFLRMPFMGIIELGSLLHINKFILHKIHRVFGSKMRFLVSGGAKLDAKVVQFFTKLGFIFLEGYGLTETAPVVTFTPPKKLKIGSVGQPIPDVNVKINEPDKEGVGEIIINGPNVTTGYYKLPQETAAALKNGWFYTGDLGYLDKDNYLYIVGRKKELIVLSSGKNISPEEVETYYAANPFIKEICVLSVGGRGEDKLMAVIVPDLNHFRKVGEININETIKWHLENLSQHYPAYKRIMGFVIAKEELPKTRLGKLKRFAIKNVYENELLGKGKGKPTAEKELTDEELQILVTPIAKQTIKILQQQIGEQHIQLSNHLEMDLGLDSLARIELMANLGRSLQVNIPETLAAQIFTVKELIINIEKLLKKPQAPGKQQLSSWAEIVTKNPAPAIRNKINLAPNWVTQICFIIVSLINKGLMKLFWRVQACGLENLPRDKPFLLCSNHNSYLDAFAVIAASPFWLKRKLFSLGFAAYFNVPIVKRFVKLIKVIPIDPALHLIDAMQAAGYVLRKNNTICIFPEGARSIDGEIKTFKKGVGILAKELKVDVVPVYIDGSFEAWPRGKTLPKLHKIKITFGKPCTVAELEKIGKQAGAKDDYEAIALGIQEKVRNI